MVMFGLFGNKRIVSNTAITSELNHKEIDVLEELMGLNDNYVFASNTADNTINDIDTSSFNLDEIINRLSVKNNDKTIDYRYALLNSLYAQVDHLKKELLSKDRIIEHLINNSIKSESNFTNVNISKNSNAYETINESDYDNNSHEDTSSVNFEHNDNNS